jgi:hypothetical protein
MYGSTGNLTISKFGGSIPPFATKPKTKTMQREKLIAFAETLSAMCIPHAKNLKKGQAVDVVCGKKKFKVIVTKPNGAGSNHMEGTANGKTFFCSFVGNEWVAKER